MAAAASKDAEFYLKRGRLYADKGKLERAAAEYTKAIELYPDYQKAYRLRAEAYRTAGDLDSALDDINKAVDLDLYDAQAFMLRGLIHKDRGEIEDYEEEFRVAVLLDGDLVSHETHGEEFARILKAYEESEAIWEELFSRPESDAFLLKMAEEALEDHRQGKTKPLKLEDL
ncbi:MAG: tetratricopeptide repeat protein [Candidatus Poribacteria bacterium]|nr:tetratricopeptide repeat protein [Candidatus Poribacteria bacterium]